MDEGGPLASPLDFLGLSLTLSGAVKKNSDGMDHRSFKLNWLR